MPSYDSYSRNYFFILGGHIADMMILSLLWLLCSLPVITMGSATSALYYATIKHFSDSSGKPASDFFRSFKQNLKQGILLSIIYLIYGGILAFDILVARNGFFGITLPSFYEQVAYVLTLPVIFTLPYVFPYLSRYDNQIKTTLKHCFIFCATHFLHTLALWFLVIASGLAMFFFPPCALLLPAVCAYLCSLFIEKDFRQAQDLYDRRQVDNDDPPAENDEENTNDSERVRE